MATVLIPWLSGGSSLLDETGLELLSFDANLQEGHERAIRFTEHPVEFGSPISDHFVIEPNRVDLRIIWSDTPIGDAVTLPDRARREYRALVDLSETGEPFTLVTGLDVYYSMVVERISAPRTSTTGYAVECDVSFREIQIANQITIQIPPEILAAQVRAKGQSEVDTGAQGTEAATDAQDTSNGSVLSDWVGGDIDYGAIAGFIGG
jgi:hypothetical protein